MIEPAHAAMAFESTEVRREPDRSRLADPSLYINRELSFLEFNQRVLAQAFDETVPLLERLRFLCISSSNLDEFFEIRVAGLKQLLELGSGQFATTSAIHCGCWVGMANHMPFCAAV